MNAIILAAGRGSRMKEKTDIRPKCLTKLGGRTLLDYQLAALKDAGIENIAVVTGYKAEEITSRYPNLCYFHNEEWANTNMVSTLLKAEEWLKTAPAVISYADIVYESSAVKSLVEENAPIALTYYTEFLPLWQKRFADPLADLETFKIDVSGNLTEIGNRAKDLDEIEGQYMGLIRLTTEGYEEICRNMDSLPKPVAKTDMTGLLSHLISHGTKVKTLPYSNLWLEVDNGNDLALYETMYAKGELP